MAILVDFSQVVLSSCYVFAEQLNKNQLAQQSTDGGRKRAENIIRHVILSQLLALKKKFSNYGELVICCDAPYGNYWRKKVFSGYKANRKKARDDSALDFKMIFEISGHIVEDLKAFFPYKVVQVDGAEADDVIGTIVASAQTFGSAEHFVIVSEDQDYVQLQCYPDVTQFRPRQKKMLKEDHPLEYLREKVIRGDKGDGIPNVLSPIDTFVEGRKQKALTKGKLAELLESYALYTTSDKTTDSVVERLKQNQRLIDLSMTPSELKAEILKAYGESPKGTRGSIFNYLMSHGCSVLLQHVQEF